MRKLDCPNCGKPCITVLRKACLGPMKSATCEVCGGEIRVGRSSWLAWLLTPASMVAAIFVEPLALKLAFIVVGGLIAMFIHIRFVPLRPGSQGSANVFAHEK